MTFIESATDQIHRIHRFATKHIKPVKRLFGGKSEPFRLFEIAQEFKKDHTSLRAIQRLLQNRNSPYWRQEYHKEQQMILYIEYLLTPPGESKLAVKKELVSLLDLDHQLSRKILEDIYSS